MEKFDTNNINYIVKTDANNYIENICADTSSLNIFFDLADDNIDMQLSENIKFPFEFCKLAGDILNYLENFE